MKMGNDTHQIESDPDSDFVMISHRDFWEHRPCHVLYCISNFINDEVAPLLWPVNQRIHDNPELGYHEIIAHDALTDFLDNGWGWEVTRSAYGLETAWVAVFDSGRKGPVVSFNAEMDALPTMGHACGHNLIASASVAAALATAEVLRSSRFSLSGKVVLFGTPAEEGGGGKIKLIKQGAYKDHEVDISLISHPGSIPDAALVRTTAYSRFRVEYFGREAHAAAEPWNGINALDGLITAYNAISVLRQQTMPGDLIQGHITQGGARPNIIHAYASGIFVVRATTSERLGELKEKIDACFRAGAMASGSRLEITQLGRYMDHVPNRGLGGRYTDHFNWLVDQGSGDSDQEWLPIKIPEEQEWIPSKIPEDQDVDEIRGMSGASSDQGDVSYVLPSLMPGFQIPTGEEDVGPHNPEFAKAAGTKQAFECAMRVAKALAGTAVDILGRRELLDEVKREWREGPGKKGQW